MQYNTGNDKPGASSPFRNTAGQEAERTVNAGHPAPSPDTYARPRIFIVDDVGINIDVLAHCLGDEYDICASQDSSLALQSIRHAKPNLILLDLFMPDIDGLDFCRIVKADPFLADIPIVFITSASDP